MSQLKKTTTVRDPEYLIARGNKIANDVIYLKYEDAVRESSKFPGSRVVPINWWERSYGKIDSDSFSVNEGKQSAHRLHYRKRQEIAAAYINGDANQYELAEQYNVTQSTISALIRRVKA